MSSNGVFDETGLFGVNVLMGKGVCRHIAPVLTDVLNERKIEAMNLNIYIPVSNNNLPSYIKYFVNMYGNHVISFSTQGNKSYFLDPTNKKIFRRSFFGTLYDKDISHIKINYIARDILNACYNFLSDDYIIFLKRMFTDYIKESAKKYDEFNKKIKYPSIPVDEEKRIISRVLMLCDENQDIFDSFYRENSEIYESINAKVLVIQKTK